jgi:type I restriction enzyme S subunit
LPIGWIALSVEQFCEIEDGDRGEHYPTKGDFSDSGHCLFLNAKNVTKRGFVFQEKSFISQEKHLVLRKGTLKRGDMVFTSRGTLGNIALYDTSISFECIRLNSGMFIIRGYDAVLTPDFLYFHLNAPLITHQIEQLQSGTAQPQLPIREFKSFRFVIPSKLEQFQIVQELESKLSEADQLDQTLATALQQSAALRQSILKKAFCGQLVKQDKNDEPAAVLLERIRAEKLNGMKPGKREKSS